ncbi:MAG: hypothetical protein ABIT16_08735 [Croceibacterium sp.]
MGLAHIIIRHEALARGSCASASIAVIAAEFDQEFHFADFANLAVVRRDRLFWAAPIVGCSLDQSQHVACGFDGQPVRGHPWPWQNETCHFADEIGLAFRRSSQECHDHVLQGYQADFDVCCFGVSDFTSNGLAMDLMGLIGRRTALIFPTPNGLPMDLSTNGIEILSYLCHRDAPFRLLMVIGTAGRTSTADATGQRKPLINLESISLVSTNDEDDSIVRLLTTKVAVS